MIGTFVGNYSSNGTGAGKGIVIFTSSFTSVCNYH